MNVWETEYRAGRWDYLGGTHEAARYGVVAAYVHHHLPQASILDVGCGEAILLRHLDPARITRYVGVDVAATALERAVRIAAPTSLVCSSLEAFTPAPDDRFDAIVFNEVLFFTEDPMAELVRYRRSLAPGGVIIVSLYQTPRETSGARRLSETVMAGLDAGDWNVLDDTSLTNLPKNLTWRVRVVR
jgi:SAM-dependent methyltransferase